MKRANVFGLCLCTALLLGVITQQGRLAALKNERAQALAQTSNRAATPQPVAPDNALRATRASDSPSIELLKLRADVARLSNRKRELANATVENANLRSQLATQGKGTNVAGTVTLPPGYIKKSAARFVGYSTPEATIQSLLWAIQNQDTEHFLQAFDSKEAKQLEARIQSLSSPAEFFKQAEALPGMHIMGKKDGPDGEIVLRVEIIPGVPGPDDIRLRQFDGQWKLVEGF